MSRLLITVLCTLLALAACTEKLTHTEVLRVANVCEKNGGNLSYLATGDALKIYRVICTDGAQFTTWSKP